MIKAHINKSSVDWMLIKAELGSRVAVLQEQMLASLPMEEYHRCRGAILMAKELIEWVEPTIPAETREDDYGISSAE